MDQELDGGERGVVGSAAVMMRVFSIFALISGSEVGVAGGMEMAEERKQGWGDPDIALTTVGRKGRSRDRNTPSHVWVQETGGWRTQLEGQTGGGNAEDHGRKDATERAEVWQNIVEPDKQMAYLLVQ